MSARAGTVRGPWVGMVRMAMVVLPAGTVRDRYRLELVAEMYEMDHAARRRHALSVAAHTWALRSAVSGDESFEEGTMRKPLRCLFGMHRDLTKSTEDGGNRYRRCTRCGRDLYFGSPTGTPGSWA